MATSVETHGSVSLFTRGVSFPVLQASASKGSEEDAEVAPASPQPVKSSKPASNLNSSAKVTKPVSETHLVASVRLP